jgi:CO/xanthine dehydrogenase FAD-binding subunit
MMITEYRRPDSLEEAIQLLQRKEPKTLPLGGGSMLSHNEGQTIAVVDLQNLGLDKIVKSKGQIEIGANATLTQIENSFLDSVISEVIRLQAGKNKRNSGTIAGLIHAADGRSPLLTLLLAMDPQLIWQPGEVSISLADWLPQRGEWHEAFLLTKIIIPETQIAFDYVSRTPKDLPIISVAAACWPSGQLQIAVGGFGADPVMAFKGDRKENITQAVDRVLISSDDQWATASYRREAGEKLTARLLAELCEVRSK